MLACQNPYPVIDGRRANCNLAALGAQKPDPSITGQVFFSHLVLIIKFLDSHFVNLSRF